MTKRIAILGGNGFIGSHIVDALTNEDVAITVMTSTDRPPQWLPSPKVAQRRGNFLNLSDVAAFVEGNDLVLHLVSTTDPATAPGDPSMDVRTNIEASVALFEECVRSGVQRVVFASSGGTVYGQQGHSRPFHELDLPSPISPYGVGKMAIEHYLGYFHAEHALQSTIMRISNPYGTRQRRDKRQGIIPIYLNLIAEGRPVPVFGDGTMVRDYIHARDLATRVIQLVMNAPHHRVYNVGSGSGYSVLQLIETIAQVTGILPDLEFREKPRSFVDFAVLDIERLDAEFGQLPLTPLHQGIAELWEQVSRA